MERDKRIETINAFRKLLDTSLKSVTKDEDIQGQIQVAFQTWVSRQIDRLMSGTSENDFTKDEIEMLKGMAQKMISKLAMPQNIAPAKPQNPAPAQNARTQPAEPPRPRMRQEPVQEGQPLGQRLKNRNMSLDDLNDIDID